MTNLLIAIFLGYLGGYRFVKHQYSMGLLYLFTYGLFGVGWVYDIYCAYKELDNVSTMGGYCQALDNVHNILKTMDRNSTMLFTLASKPTQPNLISLLNSSKNPGVNKQEKNAYSELQKVLDNKYLYFRNDKKVLGNVKFDKDFAPYTAFEIAYADIVDYSFVNDESLNKESFGIGTAIVGNTPSLFGTISNNETINNFFNQSILTIKTSISNNPVLRIPILNKEDYLKIKANMELILDQTK